MKKFGKRFGKELWEVLSIVFGDRMLLFIGIIILVLFGTLVVVIIYAFGRGTEVGINAIIGAFIGFVLFMATAKIK